MSKISLDIKRVWSSLCLSTKLLFILCFAALVHTALSTFINAGVTSSTDEAIRTVMISIFGYIFGENNSNRKNIGNKKFQIYVAGFVAFVTLSILIFSKWMLIDSKIVPLVEFKNLLFASIGFLTSKSKSLSELENKNYLSSSNEDESCN